MPAPHPSRTILSIRNEIRKLYPFRSNVSLLSYNEDEFSFVQEVDISDCANFMLKIKFFKDESKRFVDEISFHAGDERRVVKV